MKRRIFFYIFRKIEVQLTELMKSRSFMRLFFTSQASSEKSCILYLDIMSETKCVDRHWSNIDKNNEINELR